MAVLGIVNFKSERGLERDSRRRGGAYMPLAADILQALRPL
jgi:hypothetical protein